MLTDEDLAAVAPRKTRTIDIHAFVDLADVDPIHFDHPYFLAPSGDSEGTRRAYQLLVEVMRSTDRAALGRFVMRTKEYLVAVRVRDDRLPHDDALRRRGAAHEARAGGEKSRRRRQVDRAVALIEELITEWSPSRYKDRHRDRLPSDREASEGPDDQGSEAARRSHRPSRT